MGQRPLTQPTPPRPRKKLAEAVSRRTGNADHWISWAERSPARVRTNHSCWAALRPPEPPQRPAHSDSSALASGPGVGAAGVGGCGALHPEGPFPAAWGLTLGGTAPAQPAGRSRLLRRGHVLPSARNPACLPALLGSHGSLQTFDNEAKYTAGPGGSGTGAGPVGGDPGWA